MSNRFTAEDLEGRPTLSVGQAEDLKYEDLKHDPPIRVWLSRCGREDGMAYDNQVSVEHLIDGKWTTVDEYPG